MYEDKNIIIINKPYNIAVHGGSKIKSNLIQILRNNKKYKNTNLELIHRIDKKTSGCVLISKNKEYLKKMQKLMKLKKIKKEYHAIIENKCIKKEIKINQKTLNKYNKKITSKNKKTISKIKLLKKFKNLSLIKIMLITGKTHQIRIHLAHSGNPIINDLKYGSVLLNNKIRKLKIKRLFLHARSIKFICPETKKKIKVKAPYDMELIMFIKNIKKNEY